MDVIEEPQWIAMVLALNSDVVCPTKIQFMEMQKTAASKLYNKILNQGFRKFCYICIIETKQSEVYAFSFAVSKQDMQIYLCHRIFKSKLEDLKYELQSYCDFTVDTFKTKYGDHVKYVMYDGNMKYVLDDFGLEAESRYFRIPCFSLMFFRLKKLNWQIQDYEEEREEIEKYLTYIKETERTFLTLNLRLGQGAEIAIDLLEEAQVYHHEIKGIISGSSKPAVLASNMRNPKYRGNVL